MSNYPTFDPSRLTKAAAAQYSSGSESGEDDDYSAPNVHPLGNEFNDLNPRKRRRVGDTKERAALGIFASDSEDDGPGRHWKKKTLRAKGMSFVSKGTTTLDEEQAESENGRPAKESDDDDEFDDDDNIEDEDDDEDGGGVGLGFGGPQRGRGFKPARPDEDSDGAEQPDTPVRSFSRTIFDGSTTLGRGFVPSSANDPVLQNPEASNTPSMPKMSHPSAFSAKGAHGKPNPKSFGARMMAKMGYVEGQGLGSEGQGRNVIIEANLRPQGVGLGAVKEKSVQERAEEKRQAKLRGEVVLDSDEEEKKRKKERRKKLASGGIDSNASTPRRQKTRYLTAEELRKAAPGLHIPDAFAPVLDMTAPGNKLLTSASGLLTPTSGAVSESTEITEARKLVRRAHADLSAFSEEWRNLEERKTWVDLDLREQELEMSDLASDLKRLQVFSEIIMNQLPAAKEWSGTINCLQKAVDHIASGSSTEEVADIAVAAIHPFFREPDWVLLQEPTRFASELKGLGAILVKSGGAKTVEKWDSTALNDTDLYRQHHKATTSYETLMYKLWFPKAMTAIRDWDVYNPTPLLAVLDAWNDLLPPFVRAQFLDNVVRKLETAVSEWNPKKKRSHKLPHLWLFPWLPYLPTYHLDPRGTGLVADVRRKFRQLIDVWDFDRGVIPGLEQWRDVLGDQWMPLIMSHTLPSMGRYLRNFRVDPSDQEPYLPMLTGALKWSDILTSKVLGEVIVAEIFPRWHEKLNEWLELPEANFEEVGAWLEWWRDQVFPEAISNLKSIKAEFARGFQVIETALEKLL